MRFEKFFIAAAIAIISIFSSGCGDQTENSNSESKSSALTIGILPDVDSVPFLIAQDRGFFKDEGLEIKIQQFKSAPERDAAFQTGNLDAVVSDMLAEEFLRAGGFEVEALMSTDGDYRLLVGVGNNPVEIVGKEVAVSKNTIIEYVTDQILIHKQIDPSSIQKVIIPQIPARLEMLQNGKLFAATMPEPMASVAVANGCTQIGSASELQINPGIFLASKKSAEEKRDSFEKLFRAYNRATEYLNSTAREEYIDDVIRLAGFPEQARDSLSLPNYRVASPPNEKDLADVKSWLESHHE